MKIQVNDADGWNSMCWLHISAAACRRSCGHPPLARHGHGCGIPAGVAPVDVVDTSPTSRCGSPSVWDISGPARSCGGECRLPSAPMKPSGLTAGAARTRHTARQSAGTRLESARWPRRHARAGHVGRVDARRNRPRRSLRLPSSEYYRLVRVNLHFYCLE